MISYESDRCTIYTGDALEIIPTIKKSSLDLIVTDPPYGVEFQSNWKDEQFDKIIGDDSTEIGSRVITEMIKVLRNKRHVYVFGPFQEAIEEVENLQTPVQIIWDKGSCGMGDLTSAWGPQWEPIFFSSKHSKSDIEQGRGRVTARLRKGNIIHCPRKSQSKYRHPTEKPVNLLRTLIETSSLVDETVFDPFAGSGATLVASIISGRKAVGIEIDPQYTEVIIERVKKAEEQYKEIQKI